MLLEVLLGLCWVLACLHEADLSLVILELQVRRDLYVLQQSLWGSALEFPQVLELAMLSLGGTATFTALRGCLLITINLSSPLRMTRNWNDWQDM